MRRQSGVTLVELMIGVVILGILLLIAAPSMVGYYDDAKIRTVAEDIESGLQQAKLAAIERNTHVEFVLTGTSGWKINALAVGPTPQTTITTRTARSGEANILITAQPVLPPAVSQVTGSGIVFNGSGNVTPPVAYVLNVTNPTNGTCVANAGTVRCLRIELSTTGLLKTCDPALPATDPRAC